MQRKHKIDVSEGYVMMRTAELKGWVLAEDVISDEGELLASFNERLMVDDEDVSSLKVSPVSAAATDSIY
jgi:hypothetical protein